MPKLTSSFNDILKILARSDKPLTQDEIKALRTPMHYVGANTMDSLQAAGLVSRHPGDGNPVYRITDAGRDTLRIGWYSPYRAPQP